MVSGSYYKLSLVKINEKYKKIIMAQIKSV